VTPRNVATHWYEAKLIVRYTATEDTYQDVPYSVMEVGGEVRGVENMAVIDISKDEAPTRDHGDV